MGLEENHKEKKVKEEGKDAPWVSGVHENMAPRTGQLELRVAQIKCIR